MKVRTLALLLVLILVIGAPAAAMERQVVGERIDIFYPPSPEIEFPAGEPFHITHGHRLDPGVDGQIGCFEFVLEVDGVASDADYIVRAVDQEWDPWFLLQSWVFNFDEGMTGTHTFTGRWYASCKWAVENGYVLGPCTGGNAKVEISSNTVTVVFVP